jgi:hypothetical protein
MPNQGKNRDAKRYDSLKMTRSVATPDAKRTDDYRSDADTEVQIKAREASGPHKTRFYKTDANRSEAKTRSKFSAEERGDAT